MFIPLEMTHNQQCQKVRTSSWVNLIQFRQKTSNPIYLLHYASTIFGKENKNFLISHYNKP